jgi:hypothetical protein
VKDIYHNWPIKLHWVKDKLAWKNWFTWHGIEISAPHHYWVFHLGPLKVIFGERTATLFQAHYRRGFMTGLWADDFTREFWRKEYPQLPASPAREG